MKQFPKIVLVLITVMFITGLFYLLSKPDIPLEEIILKTDNKTLSRGKYLAENVMTCFDCHSVKDWKSFTGPIKPEYKGAGGEIFGETKGFPGNFYAGNITPSGIGDWTDSELYRAISSGVRKDGTALFPVMHYDIYGKMDKEDILSVISYIRTLNPIPKTNKKSSAFFPLNIFIRLIPEKAEHRIKPDSTEQLRYGKYLTDAALCWDCHTEKDDNGKILESRLFSGGFEFPLPTGGIVRSANITPDEDSGIGDWSEDMFVEEFKAYADSSFRAARVEENEFNSVMPWISYSQMTTSDLKAIYQYLRTVKAVNNEVERFSEKE